MSGFFRTWRGLPTFGKRLTKAVPSRSDSAYLEWSLSRLLRSGASTPQARRPDCPLGVRTGRRAGAQNTPALRSASHRPRRPRRGRVISTCRYLSGRLARSTTRYCLSRAIPTATAISPAAFRRPRAGPGSPEYQSSCERSPGRTLGTMKRSYRHTDCGHDCRDARVTSR